jgi:hypothetical protein
LGPANAAADNLTRPAGFRSPGGGNHLTMGDYERSTTVGVPVDDLFEYLSRIENLPQYIDRMTEAHSLTGDEVSVEARVEPQDVGGDVAGEHTVRREAWFRIDADHRKLVWGSAGPHDYHGELVVSPAGDGSQVTVRLHTEHDDAPGIEEGIAETLATIDRIAASDPELNPGAGTT